jgi:hypothetical protein
VGSTGERRRLVEAERQHFALPLAVEEVAVLYRDEKRPANQVGGVLGHRELPGVIEDAPR